jgi:hypothetical protein
MRLPAILGTRGRHVEEGGGLLPGLPVLRLPAAELGAEAAGGEGAGQAGGVDRDTGTQGHDGAGVGCYGGGHR